MTKAFASTIVAVAMTAMAGAAPAATYTFDAFTPDDRTTLSFDSLVDFTVSAISTGGDATISQNRNNGLGVITEGGGSVLVGGGSDTEGLVFAFASEVILTGIDFRNFGSGDDYSLTFGTGSPVDYSDDPWMGRSDPITTFTVKTVDTNDTWRLRSITYEAALSAIPVPAAGFLLLGRLALIAGLRRRG